MQVMRNSNAAGVYFSQIFQKIYMIQELLDIDKCTRMIDCYMRPFMQTPKPEIIENVCSNCMDVESKFQPMRGSDNGYSIHLKFDEQQGNHNLNTSNHNEFENIPPKMITNMENVSRYNEEKQE